MAGREMATEVEPIADDSDVVITLETAAAEADSLAPAVSRAARILDVLAESNGGPVGPSELARRRAHQFKEAVSAGSKAWRDQTS